MRCNNEIKENEVNNIYKIEYMVTSNWVMGAQRMIWVLELNEDEARRSLYVGRPLVPKYRDLMTDLEEDWDKRVEEVKEGKLVFANRFDSDYYYEFLTGCKVWNWAKRKSDQKIIDGGIYDIAFFTKDSDGNDKICRYQFESIEMDPWIKNQFNAFFETMPMEKYEPVTINKETTSRSQKLLPGNFEDD